MVKSTQKYSRDCRLGRNYLNRLFGKVVRRPEEQCWELEWFVINVISGIDFGGDVRHAGDVHRFNIEMGTGVGRRTREIWKHWFENKETGWPVVEKQDGNMVWTWFKNSRQMGDWVPLGEPCPIVYKLVKREDGKGFNKVRIEERIKISHETCRRFMDGELSPKELREMWEDEPEEFEEWYREICKEWYSEGIFKNKYTHDQIEELIDGFNTDSLTDRQLEIFKVYYPDTYRTVSAPKSQ